MQRGGQKSSGTSHNANAWSRGPPASSRGGRGGAVVAGTANRPPSAAEPTVTPLHPQQHHGGHSGGAGGANNKSRGARKQPNQTSQDHKHNHSSKGANSRNRPPRAEKSKDLNAFSDVSPSYDNTVDGAKLFERMREEQMRNNQKLLSQFNIDVSDSDDDTDESDTYYEQLRSSGGSYSLSNSTGMRASGELSLSSSMDYGSSATPPLPSVAVEQCLVCLERVKPDHAIWQCSTCYCSKFHLACIQAWVKEAEAKASLKELAPGIHNPKKNREKTWHCPNCRTEYLVSAAPKHYYCFCGKTKDPEPNPWITPHSCGEMCEQELRPKCGHRCTEQCHPGRCPPCPQQLQSRCFCGAMSQVRRCSDKHFSCGRVCSKVLECMNHKCALECHDGPCPPCDKTSEQSCRCGRSSEVRPCAQLDFQCQDVCGKKLSCGHHSCSIVCHVGDCPPCERSLPRSCYCGKKEYKLPCTEDVPSCGGTCGKLLSCGKHRCANRCHPGECSKCALFVTKTCRCGSSKKELPCWQDYRCEKKCDNWRDCKRHRCHQKCCLGGNTCAPCQKTCDRRLNCNNHSCEICHTGKCEICPRTMEHRCPCGTVRETAPCGPKRVLGHLVPRHCRGNHTTKDVTCAHPEFLECDKPCGNVLNCGVHRCSFECHVVAVRRVVDVDPRTGCVFHSCRQAATIPNTIEIAATTILHSSWPGLRLLEVKITSHEGGGSVDDDDTCDYCDRICGKSLRGCNHKCQERCHLNGCPPCPVVMFFPCHCRTQKREVVCSERQDTEAFQKLLCCGNKCQRQLQYCNHLCSEICHTGPCPSSACEKKVAARCPCKHRKELMKCCDVQVLKQKKGTLHDVKSLVVLQCDETCASQPPRPASIVQEDEAIVEKEPLRVSDDIEERPPPQHQRNETRRRGQKQGGAASVTSSSSTPMLRKPKNPRSAWVVRARRYVPYVGLVIVVLLFIAFIVLAVKYGRK